MDLAPTCNSREPEIVREGLAKEGGMGEEKRKERRNKEGEKGGVNRSIARDKSSLGCLSII